MKRREFIRRSSSFMAGISLINIDKVSDTSLNSLGDADDIKEYLSKILYTSEEVDGWFSGKLFPFSKFHREFGWLVNNNSFRDGINNSWSVYTFWEPDGERIMSNYRYKPCRINTYGNSFTMCHQVSDHETWQEVLAAHIQEPVRNFGIGGWSVYQAYLRMLKEEKYTPADFIIFNIYDDDHYRNLDSWRNIRVKKHPQHIESTLPFLKVDIRNNRITGNLNPCPTHQSYYKLCDLEQAYNLFKDDFVLKIMTAHEKSTISNLNKPDKSLAELSKIHGIETRLDISNSVSETADQIHKTAAIFSSCRLVEKIEEFAAINRKKVLYVLSYPASYIARHYSSGERWDHEFIDFMAQKNLPVIDLSQKHLDDFSSYKTDIKSYLEKYFIGHYNPSGNFFCAQAIIDKLVEMINPKPISYIDKT